MQFCSVVIFLDYRMASYIRKGLEIPEPSDCSSSEDDDITYLTDLYQPEHQLPESVRVINKLLNSLVDGAWEVISKQDSIRKDAEGMRKVPVLNPIKEVKVCLILLQLGCRIMGERVQNVNILS